MATRAERHAPYGVHGAREEVIQLIAPRQLISPSTDMPRTSFLLSQPPKSRYLLYSKGRSAIYQCEADPRFSYCMYIPRSHPVERLYHGEDISKRTDEYPLTVLIHHAYLNGQSLRDDWADWAEENQTVLLCPIFPYSFPSVSDFRLCPVSASDDRTRNSQITTS